MKKLISLKNIVIFILTVCCIAFIIMIGPADSFHHGFLIKEEAVASYNTYEITETANLVQAFSPENEHFKGYNLLMLDLPEGRSGTLVAQIMDQDNTVLETDKIDLSSVYAGTWYVVHTTVDLDADKTYFLKLSAENCSTYPSVLCSYNQKNSTENGICNYKDKQITQALVINYGYAISTFTIYDKFFFVIGIVSIYLWIILIAYCKKEKIVKTGHRVIVLIAMSLLLCWTYMYNTFDAPNDKFSKFQADSESLVLGVIAAQEDKSTLNEYGLGYYENILGSSYNNYNNGAYVEVEDGSFVDAYSTTLPQFLVVNNAYINETFLVGREVLFKNNEKYRITDVKLSEFSTYYTITLDANTVFSEKTHGSIADLKVIDEAGNFCQSGKLTIYPSQFGLQGKIFRHLSAYMDYEGFKTTFYLICTLLAALVFTGIVYMVKIKYNNLMAVCFFLVFWLSPWVVNFARNLYWVEFTWFLPMLVGLICAKFYHNKVWRLLSYAGMFVTIFIKCLCGYEYITTIMLGGIVFLLIDWLFAIVSKEKEVAKKLAFTIFFMGIAALLGFVFAILIHAGLRGEGDVIQGVVTIFKEDVIRRTSGLKLEDTNSNVWDVLTKYFHFSTEVIAGISGSLFPILSITPIFIFVWNYFKKTLDWKEIIAYGLFFITTISWFVLAKSHSFIHTHMNYVLWYFGYVQICLYIILNQISKWVNHGRQETKKEN